MIRPEMVKRVTQGLVEKDDLWSGLDLSAIEREMESAMSTVVDMSETVTNVDNANNDGSVEVKDLDQSGSRIC